MSETGSEPRVPGYSTGASLPAPPPGAIVLPPQRRGPTGTSAWLGVLGLIVCLFAPWGAVASLLAIVLGFISRSVDPPSRAERLVGIVSGFVGLVLAAVWVLVVLGFAQQMAARAL
ncbi:hypothetical protein WDJ51_06635 [Rathayibacter sp. YIM 133350]|uniref:hypothetical protein n=1 Tax=Rathayibacter sp. YIM 133350 TaxID=3131992 RepID=UPI00307D3C5F